MASGVPRHQSPLNMTGRIQSLFSESQGGCTPVSPALWMMIWGVRRCERSLPVWEAEMDKLSALLKEKLGNALLEVLEWVIGSHLLFFSRREKINMWIWRIKAIIINKKNQQNIKVEKILKRLKFFIRYYDDWFECLKFVQYDDICLHACITFKSVSLRNFK